MLNLTLRDEFKGERLSGTTIDFSADKATSALQKPTAEFLSITYPSVDLLQILDATQPGKSRPVVLLGGRGQGKSHLMAAMWHGMKDPAAATTWLAGWAGKLNRPELNGLKFRTGFFTIAESLHQQRYKFLWDLLFERHPKGSFIKGKWEGADPAKKTDMPNFDLLIEMFKAQPTALLLDEFQTWYDGLTDTKQYPWRKWAFNFIQLLSEIANDHPDLLVLLVSIRDNQSQAYQQIHRINPVLVDFQGVQAKKDRQRLLLYRIFQNRLNVPAADVRGLVKPHVEEFLRLTEVPPPQHQAKQDEFVEAWPYSPVLMQLLEDQVLVATEAQEIRETPKLWELARCPKDGGLVFCYDHTEVLTWRHLNIFQHRCEITCRLPRGKCRQCGHVFRVRPPWEGLSTHFTKEFEAYALLLIREMPMAKVAEVTGEGDTRLWRMLFKHVEAAYAEADFSNVCCVGVDEMSVRKGHEYVSVFADLVAKRVLFATEGKDKATWTAFVEALEKHNGHRHSITQVSMDMSAAYEVGVKENCRNAQVVFDKFHVVANVSTAVDKVRRAELRTGGKGIWESLHKSQWLWRKNPENLSAEEQERLGKIKEKNLCTAKAYQMRLVLQDIYRSPSATVARRRFKVWCRWVRWVARFHKPYLFASMIKVAQMVENHLAGILAHWKWGVTNAFMEGLNSVFSAVKRKARGFRSSVYLITVLYLVAGKLRLPQR